MCGINGFLSPKVGKYNADAEMLLSLMNEEIKHRGPDNSGQWCDHNQGIYLGHQRLSIIDLSTAGNQPMTDENKNWIVFNGEIFNFKEFKRPDYGNFSQILAKGRSDGLSIASIYQYWWSRGSVAI